MDGGRVHLVRRPAARLAEDAGLFPARVRTVVQLSGRREWIEHRWASLGLPADVEVVDILDFRHLQQHVGGATKASWGDGSSRTKTWSKKQIDAVRGKGPQPLLNELARIRPRRAEGREEMPKLREYVSRSAHRLSYPEFIARELPIGSGAIEGGVRLVNNERLNSACIHRSVAGARAVLDLRAAAPSPLRRWHAFWAGRPLAAAFTHPRPGSVTEGGLSATFVGRTLRWVEKPERFLERPWFREPREGPGRRRLSKAWPLVGNDLCSLKRRNWSVYKA